MGYLDGLLSGIFKKDGSGRTVFFPSGAAGKGRTLENAEIESALRTFLRRYCLTGLLAVISTILLTDNWYHLLLLALALNAWYYYRTRKLLAHCPVSEEKLSLKEIYATMARAHSELFLWALLAASLLISAAGLWAAIRAIEGAQKISGGAVAMFFGTSCAVLVYMISVKDSRRQSGSGTQG